MGYYVVKVITVIKVMRVIRVITAIRVIRMIGYEAYLRLAARVAYNGRKKLARAAVAS